MWLSALDYFRGEKTVDVLTGKRVVFDPKTGVCSICKVTIVLGEKGGNR